MSNLDSPEKFQPAILRGFHRLRGAGRSLFSLLESSIDAAIINSFNP